MNNVKDTKINEEIGQIKKHESQLLQQNMDFLVKLTKLETTQDYIKDQVKENQKEFTKQMQAVKDFISFEIQNSVGVRVHDLSLLVQQQQETQNKIVEIQARQGEQIDEINRTLQQFSNMELKMIDHENRIKSVEQQVSRIDQVDKVRVQGKWSLITAIAAGLIAAVSGILLAIIK